MLGRLVSDAIKQFGSEYPLGKISEKMRAADLTIINLECAITDCKQRWHGLPKAFYFGAPHVAAETLKNAGVDLVSLANNHILDFDCRGLQETLHFLEENQIAYAGAGENAEKAHEPAILTVDGIRFGMLAFCDHQGDFSARADRSGMAYLDLGDEGEAIKIIEKAAQDLQKAKVDWPILSLHWGPNMVDRPSQTFQRIAHAAIDAGFKILFGHSAHVFQGIEIYRGSPIFYATGDLVDDYYVDSAFKNDHQLLFELLIREDKVTGINLYPVFIENCRTIPANDEQYDFIAQRASMLCAELGSKLIKYPDHLALELLLKNPV